MLSGDATIGRATAKRERTRKPYVTENQNPTETHAKRPKRNQLLNMQNRQNTTPPARGRAIRDHDYQRTQHYLGKMETLPKNKRK